MARPLRRRLRRLQLAAVRAAALGPRAEAAPGRAAAAGGRGAARGPRRPPSGWPRGTSSRPAASGDLGGRGASGAAADAAGGPCPGGGLRARFPVATDRGYRWVATHRSQLSRLVPEPRSGAPPSGSASASGIDGRRGADTRPPNRLASQAGCRRRSFQPETEEPTPPRAAAGRHAAGLVARRRAAASLGLVEHFGPALLLLATLRRALSRARSSWPGSRGARTASPGRTPLRLRRARAASRSPSAAGSSPTTSP